MVTINRDALKYLKTLDRETRKLIGREIRRFQNGEPVNLKKLKGDPDKWRISAGDWRVIMRVLHDKGEIVFEIVEVTQRKDAYR